MRNGFEKVIEVVHRHMETPSTSWSIGSFGAIAEFHVDGDETMECRLSSSGGTVQSARGAIHIDLEDEITRETLVTRDGDVVHPRVRELLGMPVAGAKAEGRE